MAYMDSAFTYNPGWTIFSTLKFTFTTLTKNKLNAVSPRTVEFMLGLTPLIALFGNDNERYNVARCPSFDF